MINANYFYLFCRIGSSAGMILFESAKMIDTFKET